MSKKEKRFRQTSILDFSFSKKRKPTSETSAMDKNQNLNLDTRELSAEAAEKRLSSNHESTEPSLDMKIQEKESQPPSKDEQIDTGDDPNTCSQELFQSSEELFPNYIAESDEIFMSDEALHADNEPLPCTSSSKKNILGLTDSDDENLVVPETQNSEELDLVLPDFPSHDAFLMAGSTDLFPEEQDKDVSADNVSSSGLNESPISHLNRSPDCCLPLQRLSPSGNHFILFSPSIRPGSAPRPYPSEYRDCWDSEHVRMPCSAQNRYPVEDQNGEKHICNRWEVICNSLRSNIKSSIELERAILKYNAQQLGKWNFQSLHIFINRYLSKEQQEVFFNFILPGMIKMALELPKICTQPVPLLKKHKDFTLTMSQKQIACLLLNAFFCNFPRRNLPSRHSKLKWDSEYSTYPDINFNRLLGGTKSITNKTIEKFKCLLNYFQRVTKNEPVGTVSFHRQYLQNLPNWAACTSKLRLAEFSSEGMIETDGHGMLQVDFANKFIGGGVLGYGCVQEEIRFIICPELIITRLFTECLGATEVLIITGVEQYSKYSGYGDEFTFQGDFQDQTPRDAWGRRYTQVVAMDAVYFIASNDQFKLPAIKRELNKAYCGFYDPAAPPHLPAIATGNWGCGAFNGDPTLKFLIQLMAASQAGRSIMYFTFGSKKLQKELRKMHRFLKERDFTVGQLWNLLENFSLSVGQFRKNFQPDLYEYIYLVCSDDNSEEQTVKNLIADVALNGEETTDIDDLVCEVSNMNDHG